MLTVDQLLYAIAKTSTEMARRVREKTICWTDGGLHIEITMLIVIGDWLDGSGWTYVMTSANVTTEGRTAGPQKASHTSRGQWAHQATAAALCTLLHRSYDQYQINTPDKYTMMSGVSRWLQTILSSITDWYKVWQLELLIPQFLRSQHEQKYVTYVQSLGKIIPWMFALGHYHYARGMMIRERDPHRLTALPHIQSSSKAIVTQILSTSPRSSS